MSEPTATAASGGSARILFVDDEALVLRSIERELRAHRAAWTVDVALGGEAAIHKLSAQPYDVLVTDIVMPGIDGPALLHHARENHPGMARIVLSGHAEFEHAVRSVPFAHQRLLKPWGRGEIAATLTRALTTRAVIGDELMRRCVSQVATLPSSPATYARLTQALDAGNSTFARVAEVIGSDMAMSAKIMQLANSAFVAAGRNVGNIDDAVRVVGLSAIRQYVASPYLHVFELFAGVSGGFDQLGGHARFTAHIATELVPEAMRSQAFLAGMLHDIGSLVLLARMPEAASALSREAAALACPLEEVERRHLSVCHAEIGAFLLGLWGLPEPICDAVARHHDLASAGDGAIVAALRVADWLAHEHQARDGSTHSAVLHVDCDEAILQPFGGLDALPKLLAIARACAPRAAQMIAAA